LAKNIQLNVALKKEEGKITLSPAVICPKNALLINFDEVEDRY